MFNDFFNQFNGRFVDLLSRNTRFVMSNMLCSAHYLQIIYSIVGFVVVDVVNYFATLKLSTDMFFHNNSMLSLSVNKNVPLVFSSTTTPSRVVTNITLDKISMALSTTKNILAIFMALVISKCRIAVATLKYTYPRFIVTSPSAVPSFLRWWGSKIRFTKFTYILHTNNYSTQCVELL